MYLGWLPLPMLMVRFLFIAVPMRKNTSVGGYTPMMPSVSALAMVSTAQAYACVGASPSGAMESAWARPFQVAPLSEREHVGLDARVEERDVERVLADRSGLADELVQPLVRSRAVALLVDVDPV
jgi:hypothetical protein